MSPSADWLNEALLQQLLAQGSENAWCEFKDGNADPAKLGDTLAALSNGAAIEGQPFGYLVFGVRDGDMAVIGTSVRLDRERAGSEGLIEFLSRHLVPRPLLAWGATVHAGHHIEAFRIAAATRQPTAFDGRERVRVKSRNQSLRDYPEHATRLWAALAAQSTETRELTGPIPLADVGEWLDLDAYRRLRGLEGQSLAVVATTLVQDRALVRHDDGRLSITMLGGLLFARQLSRFSDLNRRAVRVIEYPGVSRAEIEMRESPGQRGFAVGFAGLLRFVMERLPAREQISGGVRLASPVYPEVSVREFVANALIHQDLTMQGTAPLIEMFRDRLEITNPGIPLNSPERLLDLPARSRNEKLAFAMRNVGLCEERGSGIDRAVEAIEQHQLPAPEIAVHGDHTRVTLFGPRPLAQMTQEDRLRACYQHACLLWVQRTAMSNATLRRRLAISDRDYSIASRILADALDAGLIRSFDPSSASKRHAKYVPHWAER